MSAKRIKKNTAKNNSATAAAPAQNAFERFVRGALVHGTGILTLLVSLCFFTATYDSAQVKLTLLHAGGLMLLALWGAF